MVLSLIVYADVAKKKINDTLAKKKKNSFTYSPLLEVLTATNLLTQ
jgi:hypothetical protein